MNDHATALSGGRKTKRGRTHTEGTGGLSHTEGEVASFACEGFACEGAACASKDLASFRRAWAIENAEELIEQGRPLRALKLLKGKPARGFETDHAFLSAECRRTLGYLAESKKLYQKVLKGTDKLSDPALWLDAAIGLIGVLRSLGDCGQARKLLDEGLSLCHRRELPGPAERLRLEEALLDRAEGRYGRSLEKLGRFLAQARRERDHAAEGFLLWATAGARRFSGRLAASKKDYLRSKAAFFKAGDRNGEGYALLGLGGVSRIMGDIPQALRWYSRANALFTRADDLFARAYSECGLGNCLRQLGRYQEARGRYLRSRKIYSDIGDDADRAYVDWGLGKIAMQLGDLAGAERLLKLALKDFQRARETRGVVLSQAALAAVWHARGRTAAAESLFDQTVRLGRGGGLHAHLEIFS